MEMQRDISNSHSRSTASMAPLDSGFTLLEMIIALAVLSIGLLSLASAIAYALMVSNGGRNVTNTKLLIVSVLEQMETLRNTKQLTFGQIANQGQVDNTGATQNFNGFPTGFQPISVNPGPDGIHGTADDLIDAGPDALYGTEDDFLNQTLVRPGYTRQILITSLSADLKRVEVTLRYPSNSGSIQTLAGVSYLNNDARSNYR